MPHPNIAATQPNASLRTPGAAYRSHPFAQALQHTQRDIPQTNLQFRILTDPAEFQEAFRLRYQVFCEETHIASALDHAPDQESDDYDVRSLHTAITEDERIIAYTRLVLPCDEFPMERSTALPPVFDRSRSVEVSRALIVRDRRGPGDVIWHLFNQIYQLCQADDMDAIVSFSNTPMANGYVKRGVPFRYMGDPVLFHGHMSHPLVIDVDPSLEADFVKRSAKARSAVAAWVQGSANRRELAANSLPEPGRAQ